jgi:subtilase family serine protease
VDVNGTGRANVTVLLVQTTDNSTIPTSVEPISHTTTDVNGFYSFTVNPTSAGTYYYYLRDDSSGTPQFTYITSATVGAASPFSGLTLWIIIAVVVIVVVVVVVFVAMRRRKK